MISPDFACGLRYVLRIVDAIRQSRTLFLRCVRRKWTQDSHSCVRTASLVQSQLSLRSFGDAFGGVPIAVSVALRIQELDPVDVDEIPVVLRTRLFVVP